MTQTILFISTLSAPFGDTERMSKFEIFNNINHMNVSFPYSIASSSVSTVIKGLLEKDPVMRSDFDALKSSSWLRETDWEATKALKVVVNVFSFYLLFHYTIVFTSFINIITVDSKHFQYCLFFLVNLFVQKCKSSHF